MKEWGFCVKHRSFYYPHEGCERCAAELELQPTLGEVLGVLEARIADLESRLLSTNRQLAMLQQVSYDIQRAHNGLVDYLVDHTVQP